MADATDLIRILTLDNFDVSAIAPVEDCLTDGRSYIADPPVSVQNYMTENWETIKNAKGLLDEWIGSLILITYAQGVAVGRGRKVLEGSDVLLARQKLCDYFPKCYVMRIESAISALEHLAGDELSGPKQSMANV